MLKWKQILYYRATDLTLCFQLPSWDTAAGPCYNSGPLTCYAYIAHANSSDFWPQNHGYFFPPSSLSCLLIQLHAAATASIYTFFKQNTAAGAYHSRIIYATQLQLRPLLEISDGEVRRPDKPQPPAPASVMNMHVNKCRERRRVPLTRPPPARSAHVYHVTESRKTPLSRRLYSSNVSWRVCSTSCNMLCQRHSCSFSWNACRNECLIFHPTL